MNLFEASHLAKSLMSQHGLTGWTFQFDHARRRFGSCQPTLRKITLSRALTRLNGLDEVRDTILHEIAHAMAPSDGHGAKWKAACKQIGARPVRCYTNDEVISPPRNAARYSIGCARCNWWVDRRRVTRRVMLCKKCRGPILYRDTATKQEFVVERAGKNARIRVLARTSAELPRGEHD